MQPENANLPMDVSSLVEKRWRIDVDSEDPSNVIVCNEIHS